MIFTKTIKNSSPNHQKSTPGRSWVPLGRPGTIRGAPGSRPEGLRSSPGASRDAPGASRRLPIRPRDALGRSRGHFFGRSFRRAFRRRLPERFPLEFWVVQGRSEACLTAQAQCFVRVSRFSSERPKSLKISEKTTPGRPWGRLLRLPWTPWGALGGPWGPLLAAPSWKAF